MPAATKVKPKAPTAAPSLVLTWYTRRPVLGRVRQGEPVASAFWNQISATRRQALISRGDVTLVLRGGDEDDGGEE